MFSRLISKFTVSTTSHQHVRIAEASLELPPEGLPGVKIQPSSRKRRVIVRFLLKIPSISLTNSCEQTVTPIQPANFLFSLDSSNGPGTHISSYCSII